MSNIWHVNQPQVSLKPLGITKLSTLKYVKYVTCKPTTGKFETLGITKLKHVKYAKCQPTKGKFETTGQPNIANLNISNMSHVNQLQVYLKPLDNQTYQT